MFRKLLGLFLACVLVLGAVGVAYATGAETELPGEEETEIETSSFTVTFETNGGSAVAAQTVEENDSAVRPDDPTREGYDFEGWYADEGLLEIYDFSAPVTADATVYAKWTELDEPTPVQEFTVTFDTDGGSAVEPRTVHSGETVEKPADPVREGYAFEGWYLDGEAFDFGTGVESDITLKALWREEQLLSFTVSFETNGGSAVASQTVEENKAAERPGDPTRSGYTFVGWYADPAFGRVFDFSAPITADVTVYARWRENQTPAQPVTNVDLRLSWLEIACGDLRPAFSPDIYSYTVYVTPEQENRSCRITCDTISHDARVEAEGPQTVGGTDVVSKVRVAGNGRYAEYTVVVHVLTFREMLRDGELYAITDRPNISVLPGTFTVGQITINGEKVTAAQSTDGQMLLVQFTSQAEGTTPFWYRYEQGNRRMYPVSIVEMNRDKYILVDEGRQLLYGSEAGVGTLYVYDPESGQIIYQTKDYDELSVQLIPTVIEKTFPGWPVTIALCAWGLLATAAVYFLVRRSRREKKKSVYFRPVFSAEDDAKSAAEGETR